MKNSHFNWDYAVENTNVEDFLSGGESLWGANQGPSNAGRQHWLRYAQALPAGTKVLELGFGAGVDLLLLKEAGTLGNVQYFGCDVTMKFCEHAALKFPEVTITHINGYDIPFADKFFDVTYMRHVLEHQQNYRWQLREVFRVTANQVFINFFLPLTDSNVDEIHFDNVFYHNRYSRSLFITFCAKHGWREVNETAHVTRVGETDYLDHVMILERNQ